MIVNRYYLIFFICNIYIFNLSYAIKIIGLYDNPNTNISNNAPAILKAQQIIHDSIGIMDDAQMPRKTKVNMFMQKMEENSDFKAITQQTFYHFANLKKLYNDEKYHPFVLKIFSDYFKLSSLALLPPNSNNILATVISITKTKYKKFIIKFRLKYQQHENLYCFLLNENFLIYQILIDGIKLTDIYSTIMHDMLILNNKNYKIFLKKLQQKNRELKCLAIKS